MSKSDRLHRRGTVLIVVTVVIVLVSLALYGFVVLMQAEHRGARLHGDRLQAEAIGDSAIEFISSLLEFPRAERAALGEISANPSLFQNVVVDASDEVRVGRFFVVSPNPHEAGFQYGVVNESSKLNLQTVLDWEQDDQGAGRMALMQLPGMTEDGADALLDWMDRDDEQREFGAASSFDATLEPRIDAANRIPTSLFELLQVRGMTRQQLFGADENLNYRVDSDELSMDASVESIDSFALPWSHFLTTSSGERNQDYFGNDRILLNDHDLRRLQERLTISFDEEIAKFVLLYRKYGAYEGDEKPNANVAEIPVDLEEVKSSKTTLLDSPLDIIGAKVSVPSKDDDDKPKIVASPYSIQWLSGGEDLLAWCDGTTVVEDRIIRGLINIDHAPKEVLSAIPAVDADLVQRIVTASRSDPGAQAERRHPAWLLAQRVIDLEQAKLILPFLTSGGDVFSGQVISFYDAQSPWLRAEIMIDGTVRPARLLYYRDLSDLGRGFRAEELMAESAIPTHPPAQRR